MSPAVIIGFGTQELILIVLVIAIIFGATRIPQLMKNLGVGIREFKSAVKEQEEPSEQAPREDKEDGASD